MRLRSLLALVCAVLTVSACGTDPAAAEPAPSSRTPASAPAVCGLWMAIGSSPTTAQLDDAATRYPVVVLNAWETAAKQRLREQNPAVTVLVYKDLSSTRSYSDLTTHGGLLPSGMDFGTTARDEPQWFATDTEGRRIEWDPFPEHWQMAVWDSGYQRAWASAVTAEAVRDGWDGVFADNDFADLGFYSDAVLAGTADRAATNQRIRDGLDGMITTAGTALQARGKLLIPNLSESRLYPGRWTEHARFGGAMEENFAQYVDGTLLTWQRGQWDEMLRTGTDGKHLNLLVTKDGADVDQARPGAAERAGFAGAALLAGDRTCWTASPTGDYSRPGWSGYQSLELGAPTSAAERTPDGVWTRSFAGGWVALNPNAEATTVTPPSGLRTTGGTSVDGSVTVGAADAVVLTR